MVVVPATITLLDVVLVLAVVVSTEAVGTIVVVVLTAVIGSAVAVATVVVFTVVVVVDAVVVFLVVVVVVAVVVVVSAVVVVVGAVVVVVVVVVEGAAVVKMASDSPQAEKKIAIGNNSARRYFLLNRFINLTLVLAEDGKNSKTFAHKRSHTRAIHGFSYHSFLSLLTPYPENGLA